MYTKYNTDRLEDIFSSAKSVYFIGIGGISMSSLAHIALDMNMRVGGYDRTPTHLTNKLQKDGAEIFYETSPEHIRDYEVIIYTAAISKDHPELSAALEYDRAGEKFCIYRADFLGYLMSRYKNRIGVSGMHGKSTTTSMISHIFLAAELDPTIVSGAELEAIGGAYRIGNRDNFIMEACEYQDSFLSFTPNIAVVLNIDMDHPDYFSDLDQIINSFRSYLKIAENGYAVLNSDCANVMTAAKDYKGTPVTFGLSSSADFTAKNIRFRDGKAEFEIHKNGALYTEVKLNVPGKHNVLNALAACAAASVAGVTPEAIAKGLENFTGAKRRMEFRGNVSGLKNGATVPLYDDYAHHPTEILATLSAALESGHKQIYAVFQPHTYSRTHELFGEFAEAFSSFTQKGGKLILADIYAAREQNTFNISSAMLSEKIDGAVYLPSFEAIADRLKEVLTDGDMLIIMGAGDIINIDKLLL